MNILTTKQWMILAMLLLLSCGPSNLSLIADTARQPSTLGSQQADQCMTITASQSKHSNEWKIEFELIPEPNTVYLIEGNSKRMLMPKDGLFSLQGLKIPKGTILSLKVEYDWGEYSSLDFENLMLANIEFNCQETSRLSKVQ